MVCHIYNHLTTLGINVFSIYSVYSDVHNHVGDAKRIEAAKAAGLLIHKKLSSLTAADRIHGWNRAENSVDSKVE